MHRERLGELEWIVYVCKALGEPAPRDKEEIEEARWFSADEARAVVLPATRRILERVCLK